MFNNFFKSWIDSKVKFNDLQAISRSLTTLKGQHQPKKVQKIKKKIYKFFKSLILYKVKFSNLKAISR